MKAFFITATGTGVGKTLVTCALASQLKQKGKRVKVLKPVVTGYDSESSEASDTHLILEALGEPRCAAGIDAVSPWRYTAPLAPDKAAALEGKEIDFEELIQFCREAMKTDADYLLIEGIGGAFVPVAGDKTVADWIAALEIPSIIVTGNYMGTLSHTLSLIEALQVRGLKIDRLIINDCPLVGQDDTSPTQDTLRALAPFLHGIRTAQLHRLQPATEPWRQVPDIIFSDI